MMSYSGGKLPFLHIVHTETVVPMSSTHKVLAVRGEDKQSARDVDVLCKWSSNVLPPGPRKIEKHM